MTTSDEELDAADIRDGALRAAYTFCGEVVSGGSQATQTWLRSLLPLPKRPYWDAFFAFCGYADDCADDPTAGPEERRRRYDRFVGRFLRLLHDDEDAREADAELLFCLAFVHFVRTWRIDEKSIHASSAAMRRDIGVPAYHSWRELKRYLHGSCAQPTVWFSTALGLTGDGNAPGALAWGYGLGILDCLVDLDEDVRSGKLYFPLEDLRGCGVRPADIERAVAARRVTPPLHRLLRRQAGRAGRYLGAAREWATLQDPTPERAVVLTSIAHAQRAIDHIARHDNGVFTLPGPASG